MERVVLLQRVRPGHATRGCSPGSASVPTRGRWTSGLSVWLPGGDLAEYRAVQEQRTRWSTPLLEVGDVRYEMLEAMRSWRLTVDADVPVRPVHPGLGGRPRSHVAPGPPLRRAHPGHRHRRPAAGRPRSAEAAAAAGTTGKGHFEQAGIWTGWLEVDGERHDWAGALGNRDRSWGPRSWGGPTMWRWFSINIDEGLHFGGIRLGTGAGDLHRGWVFDGGRGDQRRASGGCGPSWRTTD